MSDKKPRRPSPDPAPSDPGASAADDTGKASGPFDVRTVQALIGLMAQHDLNEVDLRDGPRRLRLRRGATQTVVAAAPAPVVMAPAAAAPASAPAAAKAPDKPAPAASGKKLLEIKSPTVGTFYAASDPKAPPFVKVGSKVEATTVVCTVEAMKLFNEITADCAGTIVEVLVENQSPVEYGQVLFRVEPA